MDCTHLAAERNFLFLLLVASSVNALQLLSFASFSNRLYGVKGAYATILTLGAIGSIIRTLIANKFKSEKLEMLLFLLI